MKRILHMKGYRIECRLVTGLYSVIFKGYRIRNNDPVAIKIVDLSLYPDQIKNKYLPREISALICIKHAYIIKIYDIFKISNKIFIFMEYANGSDLAEYLINNGSLQENQAKIWFRQISLAVQYLHEVFRLAHRDIKLDNILLHNNDCKLTDFGFSKISWDMARNCSLMADTYCGTEPYLSPQLASKTIYDPYKADIWSMGVVLYCLLNNRFPYIIGNIRLMIIQQYDQDHIGRRWTRRLSNDSFDLVRKLLETDERLRFSIDSVIAHRWLKIDQK